MQSFFCFSQTLRNKTGMKGLFFILCLLPLIFCLSACQLNAGTGAGTGNNPSSTQPDLFVPDEGKLPPAAELEPISEADVLGIYTGSTHVEMDGKPYGPYAEEIKIKRKDASGELYFVSPKIAYKGMQLDIGYQFEKTAKAPASQFILTPAKDGKSFSFSGKNGTLLLYNKGDSNPFQETPTKTAIEGFIYKKGGKVYIGFRVEYDMKSLRESLDLDSLVPKGTHKSMSSTMKNGTKK